MEAGGSGAGSPEDRPEGGLGIARGRAKDLARSTAPRHGRSRRRSGGCARRLCGVDVFLGGDFVGSSFLEEATDANVDAFGVFAKDHHANVVADAIFQRGEALVEELGGPGVDVEVEFETQAEENVGGVLIRGDTRVAESTEEDGVELVAKHFDGAFGEGDFFAEEFVGAPVEVDELDVAVALGGGGFDDVDGDGGDFLAYAVAGNDRDARVGAAFAKRNVRHGSVSDGDEMSTG